MTLRVLDDTEVLDRIRPDAAIALMREALVDAWRGRLVGPPRVSVDAGATFTLTVGGSRDGVSGMRVYGDWGPSGDQITPVWDATGQLIGAVTGSELGTHRTGALGGAAVDALARPDSARLGVIGSGRIAWAQVWAVLAVRPISRVSVFSPNAEHRSAFAERATRRFGVDAIPVDDAEAAVRGQDIVIVSTTATSPIIRAEWLDEGTHLTSTGLRGSAGAELGAGVAERAALIASDSPAQAIASRWPVAQIPEHLGGIIAGDLAGRAGRDDITLYSSVGLAGTEVRLAASLLRAP